MKESSELYAAMNVPAMEDSLVAAKSLYDALRLQAKAKLEASTAASGETKAAAEAAQTNASSLLRAAAQFTGMIP
ncbi:hypothetical protein EON64_20140 [archaeon]|nr:MAG: hypothetical protein EON64_20140 [archaeon]